MSQEIPNTPTVKNSIDFYYKMISNAVQLKLLESVMDLNLAETLAEKGSMGENELISHFKLTQKRAKKWLNLLTTAHFLEAHISEDTTYRLGPVLKILFEDSERWWYYKQMVNSTQVVSFEKINAFLQGAPARYYTVNWPPKTLPEIEQMEKRMSVSAKGNIEVITPYIPTNSATKILDVGGGDGTIACHFAKKHPLLHFTVYNLPDSAKLAKKKITSENLDSQIDIIEGNFIVDNLLPYGFDIILLSRVLSNYPEDICKKILTMAFNALNVDGYIIICESFKEQQEDLVLSWEYRFLFSDDFGRELFKESKTYIKLLEQIGFSNCISYPPNNETVSQVIQAWKK